MDTVIHLERKDNERLHTLFLTKDNNYKLSTYKHYKENGKSGTSYGMYEYCDENSKLIELNEIQTFLNYYNIIDSGTLLEKQLKYLDKYIIKNG